MPETQKCLAKNCRARMTSRNLLCGRHAVMLPYTLQQEIVWSHRHKDTNPKAFADAKKAMQEQIDSKKGTRR